MIQGKPPRWIVYVAHHFQVGPDLYVLEHRTSDNTHNVGQWLKHKQDLGWDIDITRVPNSRIFMFQGEAEGGMVSGIAIPAPAPQKGTRGGLKYRER